MTTFSDKSNPNSIDEFLSDFINETITLTESGIMIQDRSYTFQIVAFICNTQLIYL